ncbi:MAG: GIY-YIG nuclease family protein [Bacteroidetes bacterium]|nr:GIY-YIG nuclease family protein [Bacteroidota bacterium]
MNKFFVYILKSVRDRKYYYGHTSYLGKRLKCHNSGKVKSTKSRRPLRLHYSEEYSCKSDALKREKFFKSIDGYNWLKENEII